jgi:hypothetical protein
MLKQMQQPAPTVLEERSDLPPSVAQVVARALAKDPEKRYQRVADLLEDLTIAASLAAAPVPRAPETDNRRNDMPAGVEDSPDEITIVRPRVETAVDRAPITIQSVPPTSTAFNPWKVLIPSAAGLLVVFAVIYAFTRNSQPAPVPQQGSSLLADPNSQPVEPLQPATGKAEEGIPAGGSTTNPLANANVRSEASPEASFEPSPSPNPSASENANKSDESANTNANANANANSNRKAPPLPVHHGR